MFKVIAASFDVELSDRVATALDGLASVLRSDPDPHTLREAVERTRPDLLLMDTGDGGSGADLASTLAGLREADDDHALIAVGDENAAALVLSAVRAGARDFLSRDLPPEDLRKVLVTYLGRAPRRERPSAGTMTGVIRGQPGDGGSLLAINYAVMRASQGHDVLLIDCTLPASEAGAALDVKFTYTLRDAIQDLSRLDRTLLSSTLARHPASGLYVLPLAIGGEDISDLTPSAILSLLLVARGLFGETILDAGGIRHGGLLTEMLQSTSDLFMVTTQKFTAVKSCKELLAQLALAPNILESTTLVVDDYDEGIGLNEEQIAAAIGLPRSRRLPAARSALVNSLNRGKPLVLSEPRHPYVRALGKLVPAGAATPQKAAPAKRRGPSFLARLVPG